MRLSHVWQLGIKEMWSLVRNPVLLALIAAAFSVQVYIAATATSLTLNKAPLTIADEDGSTLSTRIASAFYPPYFETPPILPLQQLPARMNAGVDTFGLVIPSGFQRDLLAGREPAIQLNVDATRMAQAFNGAGYVQAIVSGEVNEFIRRYRPADSTPIDLVLRAQFNSELNPGWFGAMMEVVNNIGTRKR